MYFVKYSWSSLLAVPNELSSQFMDEKTDSWLIPVIMSAQFPTVSQYVLRKLSPPFIMTSFPVDFKPFMIVERPFNISALGY